MKRFFQIFLLLLVGEGEAQFNGFGNLFGNQPGMGIQMQNNQQPQQGFNLGNFGNGGIQMTNGFGQGKIGNKDTSCRGNQFQIWLKIWKNVFVKTVFKVSKIF